jgi:hypothetical protein
MAAPKGNKFWEARTKHGRDRLFLSSDDLWAACCEYFTWVEENPLLEMKLFSYQGEIVKGELTKMRAMTIGGLCRFLDIAVGTWYVWRDVKDFKEVVAMAESVIWEQKFTGAAADLLNQSIISHELGLMNKQDREDEKEPADILKKIAEGLPD